LYVADAQIRALDQFTFVLLAKGQATPNLGDAFEGYQFPAAWDLLQPYIAGGFKRGVGCNALRDRPLNDGLAQGIQGVELAAFGGNRCVDGGTACIQIGGDAVLFSGRNVGPWHTRKFFCRQVCNRDSRNHCVNETSVLQVVKPVIEKPC